MSNVNLKVKILKIWEIIRMRSDEEHPVTTREIVSGLADLGIVCDRRTVGDDINALRKFGYPIEKKTGTA